MWIEALKSIKASIHSSFNAIQLCAQATNNLSQDSDHIQLMFTPFSCTITQEWPITKLSLISKDIHLVTKVKHILSALLNWYQACLAYGIALCLLRCE